MDATNFSIAVGINDSQDTVGGSHGKLAPVASEPHAFSIYPLDAPLTTKNDLSWPLLPAGGVGSFAYGVNESGHVVGNWYIPPAPLAFTYPFFFDGSKMLNLPTPPYPEGSGQAFGINIHDDVVGIAASGKPSLAAIYPIGWAALWPSKDHSMININTLLPPGSGWKLTAAYGINDAGHIVGKGEHSGAIHAFLWLGSGAPIDLGTLAGGDHSVAFALNSHDEVVGYSNLAKGGGTIHGFVWKEGVMKDIGVIPPYTNSVAQAINEKGCVVGDTFLPTLYKPIFEGGSTAPTSHGVYYDGVLIDVNTLVTADSGWELKTANDINNECQIVGAGNFKGSKYLTAYVLTPPGVALTSGPKPGLAAGSCPLSVPSGGYIFDNWNVCGVSNGPTKETTFSIDAPYLITFIATYHWNDGKGALPGSEGISLKDSSGKVFGPWTVTTSAGSGGKPNVNWECHPGMTLPAGTYTIIDPDPETWSQNGGSGNKGFVRVAGSPKK